MIRRAALVLALLAGAPSLLAAQYFGQNRVQYRAFDFQVLRTEHFDIYYYPEARAATLDAGRMAERSYVRLSRILRHEYTERKPIILYGSHSDFQQTNALGGQQPGEGTGGVTDFFKQRIILPFTGSYQELEHVLQHEMVHQFQYDIWSRGRAGAGLQTLMSVNPPLWFVEGMAEYLSIGTVDPNTAMWLRDAAREGKIPTLQQLETDPNIFPYRFGQALLAFIGQRWGDEAIGAMMHGTLAGGGGLPGAVRRVLGVDYPALSALWKEHIQKTYLPEVVSRQGAEDVARPVLTAETAKGTLHLSPALSPDGTEIVFFGERDFYFIDLWLASTKDGHVSRRLAKSSYNSNYETFRFITSAVSWSPDGTRLAIAAKSGPRDDIVILDVKRNREARRIKVALNGVTTPSWSPDGRQLVFTGYDGGLSDLFIVDADGKNLRRLTRDRYAELHPVWSLDGARIAFTTDRGPDTDFDKLRIGNTRIATLELATGNIEVLPGMDAGKNASPQWSPDGGTIAFISDRTGVSNIFLFARADSQVYQITDLFTGAQGITPLSPNLSWARSADQLAFVYYARDQFDVYVMDNPLGRRGAPWQPALAMRDSAGRPLGALPPAADSAAPRDSAGRPLGALPKVQPIETSGAIYVTREGLRPAQDTTIPQDTLYRPVSITALMDSIPIQLPDTAEFSSRKYKVHFRPDYVAQPTIGYTRDNFGQGIYGGSAILLSDMLGDHNLYFSLYINGRITEAQLAAYYFNLTRRLNWGVGLSQEPYYYLEPTYFFVSGDTMRVYVTNLRRTVIRSARTLGSYPVSRFQRVELGLSAGILDDRVQSIIERFTMNGIPISDPLVRERSLGTESFVLPSAALVFDNSLFGYVAPFMGRRYRFQAARSIGGIDYFEGLADVRRYDKIKGMVNVATRLLYFGRVGPDASRYQIFLGSTELVRGNTSGSYYKNECQSGSFRCYEIDRLLGTRIAVANAELRFPILTPMMGIAPRGFPPIEGALFFDMGVAWNDGDDIVWRRERTDNPLTVREPIMAIGASARVNLFGFMILRLDMAIPQRRPEVGTYWTLSLGPAF